MNFKFKVALDAAKGIKPISQIASEYKVHPTLLRTWKNCLSEEGLDVFKTKGKKEQKRRVVEEAQLYEQIG